MSPWLVSLPVVLPLFAAATLAGLGRRLARRAREAVAAAATLGALAACAALLRASLRAPMVAWFGGWQPRGGIAVGIAFAVDPAGAGLATLSALLVLAAIVFSLDYFKSVGPPYHVLLLVLLAALCGLGLTGDLFNLFVFFELMSAASFALAGYESEDESVLQGALNFGVTNTIGAFLVLFGIGLLYGRTGALNLAQIGRSLGSPPDALVRVAFALIACGFSVKAAIVPFHFWLADAHAVAPAPVCILFSGVMVEAGLFAVVRVFGSAFQTSLSEHEPALRALLATAGALSAAVGAAMAFAQRHLKRLLAFSTIAHVGLMAAAAGLLDERALSGAISYALGHGLLKAGLFLIAGIVLSRLRSVDELALRGKGKPMPWVGALFGAGGLALAGAPPSGLFFGEASVHEGARALGYGWLGALGAAVSILTGGAVLRAAARIFLGWGPRREEQESGGETSEAPESPAPRRTWLMSTTAGALIAAGALSGLIPGIGEAAHACAVRLLHTAEYGAAVLDGAPWPTVAAPPHLEVARALPQALLTTLAAALLAALVLERERRLPSAFRRAIEWAWRPAIGALRAVHSGELNDYVAWLTLGVAAFGGACALWLR